MQRMIETNYQTIEKHARNLSDCAEWLVLTAAAEKIAEGNTTNASEATDCALLFLKLSDAARAVQMVSARLKNEVERRRKEKATPAIDREE